MLGILAFVAQFVAQLPALIAAGESAAAQISATSAAIKQMIDTKTAPTQAQWDTLNALITQETAELN